MIRTCSYLRNRRGVLAAGLVLAAMAAVPLPMWGQWNGTNPVWTNSNVGIGTASPSQKLSVFGGLNLRGGGLGLLTWDTDASIYGHSNYLIVGTNGIERMRIDPYGNVGIGTTNPQYKLAVSGNIGALDIIVTNTGWSDYVFKPGYRLRPLSEVSQYIQKNGHLPDIPTEAEVKEKGVSLGDMQAKLLAKVEELTLHMIQQEKDNRDLRDQMNQQTKEIQELRERMALPAKDAAGALTPAAPK
ncbi:MAG: TMF family protein [Bryobacterales bacterium]|nr:TMF family protein [Bryobacterales bacterium]